MWPLSTDDSIKSACQWCGGERARGAKKFCSLACYNAERVWRNRQERPDRKCQVCGDPISRKGARKFCSHECYRKTTCVEAGTMKVCRDCGQEYQVTRSTARANWCSSCRAAYYRARKDKDRLMDRERHLRAKFGITMHEYDALLRDQNGVCGICGAEPRDKNLAVDHCHSSGKIRGLLCFNCNSVLGKFKDSADLLRLSADYLEKHRN